jgi:hypothetical protein
MIRFYSGRLRKESSRHRCHRQCLLSIEPVSTNGTHALPKAILGENAATLPSAVMSFEIRLTDLATQSADMVIVCSTSKSLLADILSEAGVVIKAEVENVFSNDSTTAASLEASSGELLCPRLFFLRWMVHKRDDQMYLRHSMRVFFTAAIEHAVHTCKTSVAFPVLRCDALNYDSMVIAELILDETER